MVEYTKRAIDLAAAVNCRNLVFGCPKNRNIPQSIADENVEVIAVRFLKEIGNYAKIKNVVFSIEPNPSIYNTNFINTTKQAIELAQKVDLDTVKVNLDIGAMISNDEDINVLRGNMHYINHIHISEPYLDVIKEREIHNELLQIIKEEGYSKYVSIEMKNSGEISTIRYIIEYVRSVFNEE